MNIITAGLCEGRHKLPVEMYMFPEVVQPLETEELETKAFEWLAERFPEQELKYVKNADCDVRDVYRGNLNLYVTGLSMALVAVLNACYRLGIDVCLFHYDRESGDYFNQHVWSKFA